MTTSTSSKEHKSYNKFFNSKYDLPIKFQPSIFNNNQDNHISWLITIRPTDKISYRLEISLVNGMYAKNITHPFIFLTEKSYLSRSFCTDGQTDRQTD